MCDQLQARLASLKTEYERGQVELDNLDKQRTYLRETLLRISGAIQVLEELQSDLPAAPSTDSEIRKLQQRASVPANSRSAKH